MKAVFILVLFCNIVVWAPASDTFFDKAEIQKENIEFLRGRNPKGFKIGLSDVINGFIDKKIAVLRMSISDERVIQKNYLELLLISLRSCYILMNTDYSGIDLSDECAIDNSKLMVRWPCVNLLDLARMISEYFVGRSIRSYTKDEIEKDIIPLVKSYSKELPKLQRGSVNYFDKIIVKLSKESKK